MRNRKILFLIFIVCSFTNFLFFSSVLLSAQEEGLDLNFNIPAPSGASAIEGSQFTFLGRDIRNQGYRMERQNKGAVIDYYQRFFKNEGFVTALDGDFSRALRKGISPEISNKDSDAIFKKVLPRSGAPEMAGIYYMRFKKKGLSIDISIMEKDYGVDISIIKYLQPEGSPDLEKTPLSVNDPLLAPPKEDGKGKDLEFIPRPPDSIRWVGMDQGKNYFLYYATSLPVKEAVEFYERQMPYQAWILEKKEFGRELAAEHVKASGSEDLGIMKSPFSDGEDLTQTVKDSYLLEFKSKFGKASISILPNFTNKKLGSMVQIDYQGTEK